MSFAQRNDLNFEINQRPLLIETTETNISKHPRTRCFPVSQHVRYIFN
jgi:hypothetical protein